MMAESRFKASENINALLFCFSNLFSSVFYVHSFYISHIIFS